MLKLTTAHNPICFLYSQILIDSLHCSALLSFALQPTLQITYMYLSLKYCNADCSLCFPHLNLLSPTKQLLIHVEGFQLQYIGCHFSEVCVLLLLLCQLLFRLYQLFLSLHSHCLLRLCLLQPLVLHFQNVLLYRHSISSCFRNASRALEEIAD